MQSHEVTEIIKLMDDYLPRYYAATIQEILKEEHEVEMDARAIRNIRKGEVNNPLVFNLILSYAQQIKTQLENLKKTAATVSH